MAAKKKKRKEGGLLAIVALVGAGAAGLIAALMGGDAKASDEPGGGKTRGGDIFRRRLQRKPKTGGGGGDTGLGEITYAPPPDDFGKPTRAGPTPTRAGPKSPGPDIVDVIKEYPEGEAFYQVVKGDYFGGKNGQYSIAYRYLMSEAFKAAKEFGEVSDDEARDFARLVVSSPKRRVWAIDRIQCNGVNDAFYGTYGYQSKGLSQQRPSQNGRAIRLLPQHANNLARVLQDEQPIRNIPLGTPSSAGNGKSPPVASEDSGHYELLWLEPVDRKKLWESDGTELALTREKWTDGTSKALPPPRFMELGMIDNTDSVEGRTWGCLPEEQTSYGG